LPFTERRRAGFSAGFSSEFVDALRRVAGFSAPASVAAAVFRRRGGFFAGGSSLVSDAAVFRARLPVAGFFADVAVPDAGFLRLRRFGLLSAGVSGLSAATSVVVGFFLLRRFGFSGAAFASADSTAGSGSAFFRLRDFVPVVGFFAGVFAMSRPRIAVAQGLQALPPLCKPAKNINHNRINALAKTRYGTGERKTGRNGFSPRAAFVIPTPAIGGP
jgi:hypothetical protein